MSERNSVLVVDDMTDHLKLIAKIIGGQYKTALAKSGVQALKYLESNTPDLILLDIQMPEMDGYEVLRRIRNNSATSKIPVLFVSSGMTQEISIKCTELNAQGYIKKPFVTEDVLKKIEQYLA